MMEISIQRLRDADFGKWMDLTTRAYGHSNHILNDWPHLRWYFSPPGFLHDGKYETLVAVASSGDFVGTYGVLPAYIRIEGKRYSFCWFVSGMVLPECRNHGIGKKFVAELMGRFDVCGIIGFNLGVKRNYERAGFHFFNDQTLRRFILCLKDDAFELVEFIGKDVSRAKEVVKIQKETTVSKNFSKPLNYFSPDVESVFEPMKTSVSVMIDRNSDYLNWRYFGNPRITYENNAFIDNKKWKSILISRHERFFPKDIYGTRIIDMAGSCDDVECLLRSKILEAQERNDSFVEFSYAGTVFDPLMEACGFSELHGKDYELWPMVTSPMHSRENHEFICLGSNDKRTQLDRFSFKDVYFSRGDSDRDRMNYIPNSD